MLASWPLLAPPLVQALAMVFDEFYFHRQRGLGAWERIGHPLDTMTVLACLAWILFVQPSQRAVEIYVVLAIVSCLFVTKDEFVHARRCSSAEQWLHALLFVLHPLTLASYGLMWPAIHLGDSELPSFLRATRPLTTFVVGQSVLTTAFLLYQTIYWNLLRRRSWTPMRPSPDVR
ncbi:hypothetical protein AKJ09_05230 [Labilithrix luteola]|uniref:Transmembrane protein n=1 Tax=Labilithrix luteola TaxID=1391654 RepID=A0A0K1PYU3_9BACT|nr:hypothetical protein [Labilithrix luteola]AKU98566.1 hypothetical protein AKJ09_05230 [Labilithrix luteola]